MAPHGVPRRLQQRVAKPGEPAADHDHLGVEHLDDDRQRNSGVTPRGSQYLTGRGIAAARRGGHCLHRHPRTIGGEQVAQAGRPPRLDRRVHHARDADAAGVGHDAAALAAGAWRAVQLDHHVAQLPSAAPAGVHLAIHDDADPQPGADGEKAQVAAAAAGAVAVFRHHCHVDVVVQRHRAPQPLLQRGAQGKVVPRRQVGADQHLAARGIQVAGEPHSHRRHLARGGGELGVESFDCGDHLQRRPLRVAGGAATAQYAARAVHQPRDNLGAADVDADPQIRPRAARHGRCRPAGRCRRAWRLASGKASACPTLMKRRPGRRGCPPPSAAARGR